MKTKNIMILAVSAASISVVSFILGTALGSSVMKNKFCKGNLNVVNSSERQELYLQFNSEEDLNSVPKCKYVVFKVHNVEIQNESPKEETPDKKLPNA